MVSKVRAKLYRTRELCLRASSLQGSVTFVITIDFSADSYWNHIRNLPEGEISTLTEKFFGTKLFDLLSRGYDEDEVLFLLTVAQWRMRFHDWWHTYWPYAEACSVALLDSPLHQFFEVCKKLLFLFLLCLI